MYFFLFSIDKVTPLGGSMHLNVHRSKANLPYVYVVPLTLPDKSVMVCHRNVADSVYYSLPGILLFFYDTLENQ